MQDLRLLMVDIGVGVGKTYFILVFMGFLLFQHKQKHKMRGWLYMYKRTNNLLDEITHPAGSNLSVFWISHDHLSLFEKKLGKICSIVHRQNKI